MSLIDVEDAKFYVNEEKRTVVCVIEDTEDLFKKYAYHFLPVDIGCDIKFDGAKSKLSPACVMPARFTGKAVCSPEDKWDVETGRMIAYERAKQKVYKSFFRHANTYMKILDEYLDRTEILLNKTGDKVSEELTRLESKITARLNPTGDNNEE